MVDINIFNYPGIKKYGKFEILGAENVFHDGPHYTSAICETSCSFYKYPIMEFQKLAFKYDELEELSRKRELFFKIKNVTLKTEKSKSSFLL